MIRLINGMRGLSSLSPKFAPVTSLLTETSEEGIRLACLAETSFPTSVSRLSLVFNAGSRAETKEEILGMSHLVRRSFGLSTLDHTSVNLTRHLQQMGARVSCTTTRESTIFCIDVAPNLIPRAGALLAEMATRTAFYHWELKSTANKLMREDVELLTRRNLPALCTELLHEAAFGKHSQSSGLGASVFIPVDRIGTYGLEQIEQFMACNYTPLKCSISLLNCNSSDEGLELLREMKEHLHFRAPQKLPETTGMVHGFVGGDIRRDIAAATHTYASIAWPTHGRGCPLRAAYDLAACLLNGFTDRIAFDNRGSPLFGGDALADEHVQVGSFSKMYSDHGLFGISLHGPNGKVLGERLLHVIKALRNAKFVDEDLARAKNLFVANLLMESESPLIVGTDLAVQLAEPGAKYTDLAARVALADAVTLSQLNEAFSRALGSSVCALSVVGVGAHEVLPLNVLTSA